MRLMILNGPNLNLLGVRELHIYGTTTLAAIEGSCTEFARRLGASVSCHQSNHEGALVDLIQKARETADALIDIPRPLYMRVGGQTYDIGDRANLEYVDMTADGSTVYFTAKDQLVPGDEDESVDMYLWSEDDPTAVTLVSKGSTGNEGNRDDCKLDWIEKCDIQAIEVSNPFVPGQMNGNATGNQTTEPVGHFFVDPIVDEIHFGFLETLTPP